MFFQNSTSTIIECNSTRSHGTKVGKVKSTVPSYVPVQAQEVLQQVVVPVGIMKKGGAHILDVRHFQRARHTNLLRRENHAPR